MPTFVEELDANYTFYQLNSNFSDPMYRYIDKLRAQYFGSTRFNFNIADGGIAIDQSPTLYYGSIPCSSSGKEAYMDSYISCALFQLPFFLENIQFGYVGAFMVLPIILISLFGGIKENYRWFLLNQAFWDAFICYDFICEKPTLLAWTEWNYKNFQRTAKCFYVMENAPSDYVVLALSTIRNSIRFAPFIPLFLLSFSRYLCVYFPNFYQRVFSKSAKIGCFIIFFNILFIFLINFDGYARLLILPNILKGSSDSCLKDYCSPLNLTAPICFQTNAKYFQCINYNNIISVNWSMRLKLIPYFVCIIMFLLTNIFVLLLIAKILLQLKYQLKHNQNSVNQSIRISIVVGIQCFTISIIFGITAIQAYSLTVAQPRWDFNIYNNMTHFLFLLQNHATTTSFNLLRTFIDSFIVLVILSGYRKCLIQTFKFIILCLKNPRKTFGKFRLKNNRMFTRTSQMNT